MALRYPSRTIVLYTLTFLACSSVGLAQITPPAGPIRRTRPTIVTGPAPIIIDQPGSYVLGGNLVATDAVNGIEISASHVTLDLDGGVVNGADVGLAGIVVIGTQSNLSILNGTITRWTNEGVDAGSASKTRCDRLLVDNNGSNTGHEGLNTGRESLVTNCVSSSNSGIGIRVGRASVIRDCVSSGNGSTGISLNHESVMRNCTAEGNTGTGITANNRCVISQCSSVSNAHGISGGGFGLIERCTASSNTGIGISGSANGTIANCVVSGGTKGISASARISILNNTISAVNGPGIYLDFKHNHVEGNTIGSCVNGIQTDNGGSTPAIENLIIRNIVRNSSGSGTPSADYDIGANNSYAQIIDVSASAGFVSTDPNANLVR